MLQRTFKAMTAAARAFRIAFAPEAVRTPRPAWDNGTNYDVPTFLRRSALG